ncbi:replicative DNA helicase [Paludibacteraceae bacterium OttesenSCG-928-F17]|nr:replicative DNA helicase [Paludibacteraceae bacterium OttesenSCG-928-F17]
MEKKNQNKKAQSEVLELGKIPPQAVELEKAVLGAVMLEREAYTIVESILTPGDFYTIQHQIIYKAIESLGMKRNPIDMHTVTEQLRADGAIDEAGGPYYITLLTAGVSSAAHVEYHARIILQKSLARKIITGCGKINNLAFDETNDVSEVVEEFEKILSDITTNTGGTTSIDMPAALDKFVTHTKQIQSKFINGDVIAIPTHLRWLNRALEGGWRPGELIIIGARPAMGKTQHALAAAGKAAQAGQDCLFVSIEMTLVQLVTRLMLEDENIDSRHLRTGDLSVEDWANIEKRIGELQHQKLHIAEHHSIRYLTNIKSEARRLHRAGQLKIMVIDYLQLIRTNLSFERRQLEVAYITGELKNLAKELQIPIIALSQLSRPKKDVKPKEPDLEDLREAGDIEQDADIVAMLHCPSYYEQYLTPDEVIEWKNKGMVIIRKSREGVRNESIVFAHDDRYKKIYDADEVPDSKPF